MSFPSSKEQFFDQESAQLLTEDAATPPYTQGNHHQQRTTATRTLLQRIYFVVIHCLAIFAALYCWKMSRSTIPILPGQSWSPLDKYLTYEVRQTFQHHSSLYSGPPTEENIKAWYDLARHEAIYFPATAELLVKGGESMVNKTRMEPEGYLAGVGVLHELHCLRMIRQYVYADYFYPDINDAQVARLRGHLDHCINNLRSSLMCRPNTKLMSFNWNDPGRLKPQHESSGREQCVRWESVQAWAKDVGITDRPLIYRVGPINEQSN